MKKKKQRDVRHAINGARRSAAFLFFRRKMPAVMGVLIGQISEAQATVFVAINRERLDEQKPV